MPKMWHSVMVTLKLYLQCSSQKGLFMYFPFPMRNLQRYSTTKKNCDADTEQCVISNLQSRYLGNLHDANQDMLPCY